MDAFKACAACTEPNICRTIKRCELTDPEEIEAMTHPEPTKPTELKSCPFCGGQPQSFGRPATESEATHHMHFISCMCGTYSARAHQYGKGVLPEIAERNAAKKWNTRTPAPASAEIEAAITYCSDWRSYLNEGRKIGSVAESFVRHSEILITALRAAQARVAELEKEIDRVREAAAKIAEDAHGQDWDGESTKRELCAYIADMIRTGLATQSRILADTTPITKDWCMKMADHEGDAEIGAGLAARDPTQQRIRNDDQT